ncbi:MAG: signal peptidase I [Oscillospiraceae bacterium]|nr:signal peptidase I [Oscillospiraceae bacterium]
MLKEKEQKTLTKKENKTTAVLKEILSFVLTFVLTFAAYKATFTYVLENSVVEGCSMEPTLHEEDRLISTKILYTPKQEDIIIIDSGKLQKKIVKRVVATEGQVVDIDFETGKVYVDGCELNEQLYSKGAELTADYFVNTLTTRNMGAFDSYPLTVPEGYIFVLGDNRNSSLDSKSGMLGFVPTDEVLGKVLMRVRPLSDLTLF